MPEILKPGASVPVQEPSMMKSFSARGKQVLPEEQKNVVVPG